MSERKIGLSAFEALFHGRYKKVTLVSEIEDCFKYFDEHTSKVLGDNSLILIHGNGLTLRRVEAGKGYSVERDIDGSVRTIGVDAISKQEQLEIVRRIRTITFPYADHVKNRR